MLGIAPALLQMPGGAEVTLIGLVIYLIVRE
jgi:hypothetical protein